MMLRGSSLLLVLWQFMLLLKHSISVQAVQIVPPLELYDKIQDGTFKILVDVRTAAEWEQGHLPGALFAENLSLDEVEPPPELMRCLELGNCPIVVYCRSGGRAAVAIQRLITLYGANEENLYNGQGVGQWTSANLPLSTDPSKDPMCEARSNDETCELMKDMEEEEVDLVPPAVVSLSADELYDGMMTEQFDVVLNMRSFAEFEAGHIPNVSLIDGLATPGVVPDLLLFQQSDDNGAEANNTMSTCRTKACHIAVTCRTGNRAGAAIERMQKEFNFTHNYFYNGGGTSQWEAAGYSLVTTLQSVVPKCAMERQDDSEEVAILRNGTMDGFDGLESCSTCCLAPSVNETMLEPPEESTEGLDTSGETENSPNGFETMDDAASAKHVAFVLVSGAIVMWSLF